MDSHYKPNHGDVAKFLRSPQVAAALMEIATDAKARAIAASPVETGDYISSFQVNQTETLVADGSRRAAAELENTSEHAAAVEWGYAGRAGAPGSHAHRVIGRAVRGQ